MNYTNITKILIALFAVVLCFGPVGLAGPVGTAFTYQGRLIDSNNAADGLYDFQFKLYDANIAGNKLGVDVNKPEADVIDGYFTVELDFGSSVFDGNAVWLQIGVRQGNFSDPNAYNILSPRQLVTPTPYAIKAKTFTVPADVSGSTSASNAVIKATNTGNGYGLYGYSPSNYGVYGYSGTVPGVYGYSGSAEGVYGVNGAWGNYGYLGGNSYGVYGYGYTGPGGYFASSGSYGLIVGSGNVGIGTPTPSEKFHVKGTGFIQGIFESTSSSGGIKLIANNAQAYELQSVNDGGFVIYDRTDSRYCMKIDTAGKTGIGTTEPKNRLDVEGAVAVGASYSGTQTAPANGMIIEGNVGIGIASPIYNLDIKGTTDGFVRVGRDVNTMAGIRWDETGAPSTQWIFPYFRGWQSDNLIVRDEAANKDVMAFQSGTGRVAIGGDFSTDCQVNLYTDSQRIGLFSRNVITAGDSYGVLSVAGGQTTGYSYGIYGNALSNIGINHGVHGKASADSSGLNVGVYGEAVNAGSGDAYAGYFTGKVYVSSDVSAYSFTDRTPYPKDLATAYEAVMSMERLPAGQYQENNKENQIDHSKLSSFIRSEDGNRDLSATVSCLNEVVKDLVKKVESQQRLIESQNNQIQQMTQILQTNRNLNSLSRQEQ